MRHISETKALVQLRGLKTEFADRVKTDFEHRAKSCAGCETQGACCLDVHFVNVHITRLEAEAIRQVLEGLPAEHREAVLERTREAVVRYGLTAEGDTFAQTFACPLFETTAGCLVHGEAKPLPCIAHACYENEADLPPDDLTDEQALNVEELNDRTYGRPARWLPLPLALLAK